MAKTEARFTASPTSEFPIAIVGSGFSGIAMGVLLRKAGIESFTILEKANDIGGTWRDNTYPGAACDVQSHLYSFSFEPKPDWSRAFSPQQEIQAYLKHCVKKYDLERHIRFGSEVTGARFDDSDGSWKVSIRGAKPLRARALVLGNGALSIPQYPDIPGIEEFRGTTFHSARWNHDYDLGGKTVAVIGTGASAIQFVPEIGPKVGKLHLFQRTPPWILPKPDREMTAVEKRLFQAVPLARWLHRAFLYWWLETRVVGFAVNPRLMRGAEWYAKRYLRKCVKDPVLRKKLTPRYSMGCKRILMSNDYFQTLEKPNVEVVTDGIERITAKGVVTRDGVERPVDAIVFGTGFTATNYLAPLDLRGRGGVTLNDVILEAPETYLGITANRFPNLYLLMGPNTGLGHNSMIFMIEAQARYALQCIETLRSRDLAFMDVRKDVQHAFFEGIQSKLVRSVWNSGCQSWYLSKDGVNSSIWPGFTFQYWLETRRLDLGDFELVAASERSAEPAKRSVRELDRSPLQAVHGG